MVKTSVFPNDRFPSIEELIALGREKLIELQNEAARILDYQTRRYGVDYQDELGRLLTNRIHNQTTGKHDRRDRLDFIVWSLGRDIEIISKALSVLDEREGVSYQIRVIPESREDIAERLVFYREKVIEYRFDEGVDYDEAVKYRDLLREVEEKVRSLETVGYPLTVEELSAAKARIKDRTVRLRFGWVRRMDPKIICPVCRASIFADSIYCAKCGELVGDKPERIVFICYGSPNEKWVQKLTLNLRKLNIDAWYDKEELLPGSSIQNGINEGIGKCDVFLFIASKDSLNRIWPMEELKVALNRRMESPKELIIIPVLLDDCFNSLPSLLKDTVYLSFYKDKELLDLTTRPGKRLFNELIDAILGKPIQPSD